MYLSNSFGPDARHNVASGEWLGWLVSPATYGIPAGVRRGDMWAGDNQCFTRAFTPRGFCDWLHKMMEYVDSCIFVVAPDVLGDPWATLERWHWWRSALMESGFPLAYVGQDGQRAGRVPWGEIDCYFVGGTDDWKDSHDSLALVTEARRRGRRVHVGRVNTRPRLHAFLCAWKLGGDDSLVGFTVDGNGWRYPGKNIELAPAMATAKTRRLL